MATPEKNPQSNGLPPPPFELPVRCYDTIYAIEHKMLIVLTASPYCSILTSQS